MNRDEKVAEMKKQVARLANMLAIVDVERGFIRELKENNNAFSIDFIEQHENWCNLAENTVDEIVDKFFESCRSLDNLTRRS